MKKFFCFCYSSLQITALQIPEVINYISTVLWLVIFNNQIKKKSFENTFKTEKSKNTQDLE